MFILLTCRLDLEVLNLCRTLENREQDLDVTAQERDRMAKLVGHRKTLIESMKKDLDQSAFIKSQMVEVQDQMLVGNKTFADILYHLFYVD